MHNKILSLVPTSQGDEQTCVVPVQDKFKFTFTIYTSTEPLSKIYRTEKGLIQKQAAAQMYKGTAERVTMSFAEFPTALSKATEKQAFGYGLYPLDYPDKVNIVVAGKEQPEKNSISRTQKFYAYTEGPGAGMFDHDPNKYGPVMSSVQLIQALIEIHPAIAQAARVVRGSVSAGIHKTGEIPRTDKGFHVYILVKNAADIPRYGNVLFDRLWINGLGFIALASNGALLVRTVIDGAVFSPERLDFVGKPIIEGEGLEYTPPEILYTEGDLLNTESLPHLTDDEQAAVKQLIADAKKAIKPDAFKKEKQWAGEKVEAMRAKGTPVEKAMEVVNRILKGGCQDLYDDFILEFTTGPVSVADVMKNPAAFDGKALADPIEGTEYGRTTAMLYWNDGKPVIHSLAHGQNSKYFLHKDPENDAKVTDYQAPTIDFSTMPDYGESESAAPIKQFQLVSIKSLIDNPVPIRWTIKGFLEQGGMNIISGAYGSGKSFVAYDMGFCVAEELEWNGHKVIQSPVIILAGEGHSGIADRFAALQVKYGISCPECLYVSKIPAQLTDGANARWVSEAVNQLCPDAGLIIVDTLNRNFGGLDENSTKDMTLFINNMDNIFRVTNKTSMVIHHTGHAEPNRARGNSSLPGACEGEFIVKGQDGGLILICEKQKNAVKAAPLQFTFKRIELPGLIDNEGEPVASLILEWNGEATLDIKRPKLSGRDDLILTSLWEAITEHGVEPNAEIKEKFGGFDSLEGKAKKVVHIDYWRERAYPVIDPESADSKCKAFKRARDKLVDIGKVRYWNDHWWCL